MNFVDNIINLIGLYFLLSIGVDVQTHSPPEPQGFGGSLSIQLSFYILAIMLIAVVTLVLTNLLHLWLYYRQTKGIGSSLSSNRVTNNRSNFKLHLYKLYMLKIFICYSSLDVLKVRNLNNALKSSNFDSWFAEEKLVGGQDWDLEIKHAIDESDIVLVLLSLRALKRTGYMQKEIRIALDVAKEKPEREIFIVPVRLDECEVPDNLRKLRWRNLIETNDYDNLEKDLFKVYDLRNGKIEF